LIEDATYKLIEEVSQSDEIQIQKDTETYFDCRTRSKINTNACNGKNNAILRGC
jgi:hypothetical protein